MPTSTVQSDVAVREHARALRLGLVARGLGIALAIVVAVAVVVSLIVNATGSTGAADDLPNLISAFGFFLGFLAAGTYVAGHARSDRMLHTLALVVGGLIVAALFTIADVASGLTIESFMPGSDTGDDVATVHLGFWAATWMTVPVGAFLAASIVPRGGEGWGTRYDEPEDTEL